MVDVPIARLKNLSDGGIAEDGSSVRMRINSDRGPIVDLEIAIDDMGTLIAFLATLAAHAGERRDTSGLPPRRAQNQVIPIPARGLGFGVDEQDLSGLFPGIVEPGVKNRLASLVVRLPGFDLAFQTGDLRIADLPAWLRASADQVEKSS